MAPSIGQEAMSGASHAATVLVVEDDQALGELYATWLCQRYDVHVVNSGEAALDIVSETAIDCVLLDRMLPDRSGDDVLVTLRDRGIDAPIAMVSGKEIETDIIDLGFDDYVQKPADRPTLLGVVERLVSRRSFDSLQRELTELEVKRNVLETELSPNVLSSNEEYQHLGDRIAELQSRTDEYQSRLARDPTAANFQPATRMS